MKRTLPLRYAALFFAGALVLAGCADDPAMEADAPAVQASASVATLPNIAPGTYAVDPAHSEVGFRVRHLGLSNVEGEFESVDGTISVPDGDLSAMKIVATIDASSINTNNTDRDDHLRSPDFFEVDQHPEITFTSTAVEPLGEDRFLLRGDLTMRGVTRPVELEGEYVGAATDPYGNEKIGIAAEGKINRKDFGLTWNQALEAGGVLVGEEVTLVLDVQAARQQAQ